MTTVPDSRLQRLQRLADGIFMLSMVLMVLQFDLPNPSQTLNNRELWRYLQQQLPTLWIYLGTYVLIVFYWLSHLNQFKHYQKTNAIHIWLTLLSLMFVVLLPYANDLTTQYPLNFPVQVFYSLVLFSVGLFSLLSWLYGSYKSQLIVSDVSQAEIQAITIDSLLEPLFCLLSIPVAFWNPALWEWTFWLLIPAYLWLESQDQSA